jgi:hypothetical protein
MFPTKSGQILICLANVVRTGSLVTGAADVIMDFASAPAARLASLPAAGAAAE